MNARQEWHAVLDDVLEGSHEDLEPIMSSARYQNLQKGCRLRLQHVYERECR